MWCGEDVGKWGVWVCVGVCIRMWEWCVGVVRMCSVWVSGV